jgi:hypothetical protein
MDDAAFNAAMAKRLQGLKKDLGALNIRQGYRGTGSRAHRRQMWVTLPHAERPIDVWLEDAVVGLGGVCYTNYGRVVVGGRSVEEVYTEIVDKLRPLTLPKA